MDPKYIFNNNNNNDDNNNNVKNLPTWDTADFTCYMTYIPISLQKKTHRLVPKSVKFLDPQIFKGEHDGDTVRILFNAYKIYFKPVSVTDENT